MGIHLHKGTGTFPFLFLKSGTDSVWLRIISSEEKMTDGNFIRNERERGDLTRTWHELLLLLMKPQYGVMLVVQLKFRMNSTG
ncbi:hypothetical protein EA58_15275 [Photobacterium galatheae]|uniref:Uncharacterized protein n=1 Tax=Photobacterium galatheae TaxID=1654360 RepID=A0A066RNT2_9GAMM|nr:hypothetical protein EA58_15275 [Photobacterium galatheae]